MTAAPGAVGRPMRDALLEGLHEAMLRDPDVFFVTADFGSPVVDLIRRDRPERFINVGVAEQNLINVSTGLALEGFKVFAYAIAPFITMRCFEQVRVDLALLSVVRPVNVHLIGVGAGYSYVVSGPTHQCFEDLSVMRALPGVRLLSPADHVAAASVPGHLLVAGGPSYVRLDAQALPVLYGEGPPSFERGFHELRRGGRVCLLATGYMVHRALEVAERSAAAGEDVGVVDLFDLSRFSEAALRSVLAGYQAVVTLEEGFRGRGGLDSLLFDFVARQELELRVRNLGVEPAYRFDLGERAALHDRVGLGPERVLRAVSELVARLDARRGARETEASPCGSR